MTEKNEFQQENNNPPINFEVIAPPDELFGKLVEYFSMLVVDEDKGPDEETEVLAGQFFEEYIKSKYSSRQISIALWMMGY